MHTTHTANHLCITAAHTDCRRKLQINYFLSIISAVCKAWELSVQHHSIKTHARWPIIHSVSFMQSVSPNLRYSFFFLVKLYIFPLQVEQNWATLQGGEMTIQTTHSEATQAVASLAEAAIAASHEMHPGATVTMALSR